MIMMDNHNKISEEQLKKMLIQAHQDVEIPDGEQSWLGVKVRLDRINKRKLWFNRIKIGFAIACTSLVISITFTTDLSTAYSHFSNLIKKMQENVVSIFFEEPKEYQMDESSKAKTSPPPSLTTGMDDAKEKLLFHIAVPTYIPAGYELDIVRIYRDSDGEYRTAFMEYVNEDGRIIQLNQRMIAEESTPVISSTHESSTINDVFINGNAGVIIIHENEYIQLEWLTSERIKMSLFGFIPEDKILLMASSLK